MGGKSRQTQRTKNNAKPSSSSRSAELLGSVPNFVGFSAHSDLGLVPFAPGFSTAVDMPDSSDASLRPELQMILRKMSKKDPMTKKRGLMELYSYINSNDMEIIKSILPLWPKFYYNLANDIEHNVRELSQTVLQLLMSKCKRAMAPYLKQLIPVWLASQFDSYAPAASIARNCFQETFASNTNRTQEVCLHCQVEIVTYAAQNLTIHTADTLFNGKNLTTIEAEQKYQRIVFCSLKELCFLIEQTANAPDLSKLESSLEALLKNAKFWSFSKHKVPAIKASWFELFYQLLQSSTVNNALNSKKSDLLTVCFQNIDESDPLVAPQVWGCILLLQSNNNDWHSTINFKKSILPKLSWLLRNGFNKNAHAICPNLLPFFSKLSKESLQDIDLHEFYEQFFDDLKSAICSTNQSTISKSDHAIIIKTYFECLRYLLQRIEKNGAEQRICPKDQELAMRLLEQNILDAIAWFLHNDCAWAKFFFLHTAALVAFLIDKQNMPSTIYAELLTVFWKRLNALITDSLTNNDVSNHFLEYVTQFLNDLHVANPCLEDHYVKFVGVDSNRMQVKLDSENNKMKASSTVAMQKELDQLAVAMVRLCLVNINKETSCKYITNVHRLLNIFGNFEFYENIETNKNIQTTIDMFLKLIDVVDEKALEIVMDIIFQILQTMTKPEQLLYINTKLLHISKKCVQFMVIHRLVSYPLCVEPQVRSVLSQPAAKEIILNIAREIVDDKSKEHLNVLHQCFFQTDTGEILIDSATVDSILKILCVSLAADNIGDMTDACGSFVAQLMPVICTNKNSSTEMQRTVFFTLFEFTMSHMPNDYISEDTLWEVTTCWQDALSSRDIIVDNALLDKCLALAERCLASMEFSPEAISFMAEALAKFVICSTEHIAVENDRIKRVDEHLSGLFNLQVNRKNVLNEFQNVCLFVQALTGAISIDFAFTEYPKIEYKELKSLLRHLLLNLCTINSLACKEFKNGYSNVKENSIDLDEVTSRKTHDPNESLKHSSELIINEIVLCIDAATASNALILHMAKTETESEMLILELTERVKDLMRGKSEIVNIIKERLLQQAVASTNIISCGSLLFLVNHDDYAQFEDSAFTVLAENLSEYFLNRNALKSYVYSLQYLLPHLQQKTVTTQSAIMSTQPKEIWIKAAVFRCIVLNNFNGDFNEMSDKSIIATVLQFINEVSEKRSSQKELLHYNVEIHTQTSESVLDTVEYVQLLASALEYFPLELSIKIWDAVRIGLSSWVLSIAKSMDSYRNPKSAIFIVSVYKLYAALARFIIAEKTKSSSELITNVIDEWENLFAREVNVILFKSFYELLNAGETQTSESTQESLHAYQNLVEEITPAVELIDYTIVYNFCKVSTKISFDNLCNFLLENLSHPMHNVKTTCMQILRCLARHFIAEDVALFEKKSESLEGQGELFKWHYLNRFEDYIVRYNCAIDKYLNEFSFKTTEITNLGTIDRNEALRYLMLWDCIIYVCANSPVSLRSVYTNWLYEHKFEENFLHFLFRAMPMEILKNYDSKLMNGDIFKGLTWIQIKDRSLSLEKYACHLYTEVLCKLPAVVRKWWNTSPSRQKSFVDKLTTNFVSQLICTEELKAISNKKEKHENMQVTVHMSTREVLAVYCIDDARMELVITLAQNYPLGGVKVECGKQIGGRTTSRNIGMQLTIFLTHQNGTIYDGLTLWKNNLDKKFEGVEECYVCYTVIHQDTCQLPKLTCKTCKKKFHGPCLYKWFTTSSKSTCPICRNVF